MAKKYVCSNTTQNVFAYFLPIYFSANFKDFKIKFALNLFQSKKKKTFVVYNILT